MIVLKQKPLEWILDAVKNYDSVLIVGCNGCSGIYQVGGEKQAEAMKLLLEMASEIKLKKNLEVETCTVLRQCDRDLVASSLRPLIRRMKGHKAILSMACGVGVQTISEIFPEIPVIPGCDTLFIGMRTKEFGEFYEFCRACGDCILFETGGICPVTRCAKGLLNGPCGGMREGKCEVDPERDCAWVLIYERLKAQGRLDLFIKFRPPRDHRITIGPRVWRGE
ncbi:MAG: hypothetical protein DRN15_05265 [Thermoprotei archaeon]|nr:MAG: hypothetical protein DRN15_05265 [Thermoprotei archaeon]RLF25374.1 MAG: hypothetical protein DRM97_02020 [Thermoprotei archaeon]